MFLFKNKGATFDGQQAASTSKGILGAPILWRPESNNEIVHKYPFDNIKNGAMVVVHQTQRAYLYLNGSYVSEIPPSGEPFELTTANIPILHNLLNLPTGGYTAHTAEIWFVNIKTEREAHWGVGDIPVFDPKMNAEFIIGAHGGYNYRVSDAELLIQKLVGTLHTFATDDVIRYFGKRINSIISQSVSKVIHEQQLSLLHLQSQRMQIEEYIAEQINEALAPYGISVMNYAIENFNLPPEYRSILSEQTRGAAERKRLEQLGVDYTRERQFNIIQDAAGNQGAGVAMGVGMGFGMGGALGDSIGQMANKTMGGVAPQIPPQQASVPPVQIYFAVNGTQNGPHTLTTAIELVRSGVITSDTQYWSAGMAGWMPISSNAELVKNLFVATPPPLPLPTL